MNYQLLHNKNSLELQIWRLSSLFRSDFVIGGQATNERPVWTKRNEWMVSNTSH